MPILSSRGWELREERARTVASLIATELRGRLWAEEIPGRPRLSWYSRRHVEDPWLTGNRACTIRSLLIEDTAARLLQEPEYRGWPELHRLLRTYTTHADLGRRLLRIYADWGRPEDLPAP